MGCSSFLSSSTSLRVLYPRSFLHHRHAHCFLRPGSLQFAPLPNAQRPCRTVCVGLGENPVPSVTELPGAAAALEVDVEKSVSELSSSTSPIDFAESVVSAVDAGARERMMEKQLRRKSERTSYLIAAIASTVGITFLTAGAVYYRFAWQTQVGMEYWARWAHEALWHDSLWSMHESHHRPRDGPFETNDVFAIINAIPAIALLAYGFFHRGLVPGLCFGAGLGITVFGIAYMFVHDGLVHRRFPVGPIADVPYFQKVAAAHQLHHADKFKGVPYGLFLGPEELEAQVGGAEELEKMMQTRKRSISANL